MEALWVWGISRGMEIFIARVLKTCSPLKPKEYLFSETRPFPSHRYRQTVWLESVDPVSLSWDVKITWKELLQHWNEEFKEF